MFARRLVCNAECFLARQNHSVESVWRLSVVSNEPKNELYFNLFATEKMRFLLSTVCNQYTFFSTCARANIPY